MRAQQKGRKRERAVDIGVEISGIAADAFRRVIFNRSDTERAEFSDNPVTDCTLTALRAVRFNQLSEQRHQSFRLNGELHQENQILFAGYDRIIITEHAFVKHQNQKKMEKNTVSQFLFTKGE